MGEALGPASRSWKTEPCLSRRATSLPEGLDGLDLGRAGQYWRCPRLPKCFRRIACTMGRTSLPLREQHLVLLALGEFTSRQDASRFLCIAPTASREEVNRAAKILRADLDRFFGDLFASCKARRLTIDWSLWTRAARRRSWPVLWSNPVGLLLLPPRRFKRTGARGPAQNHPQCPPNRPLTHGTRLGGEWG